MLLGPRRLALLSVLLTFGVAQWTAQTADAQVPTVPTGLQVPGTMNASGTYTARVGSAGQFFERSGTYDASVTFTATVAVSGVNILALSGNFDASGPFTATVSAPGVTPFTVQGTYTAAGTFAPGTFTSSGQWVITTGGAASGSHRGTGTYDLARLTAVATGQYDGSVTSSPRGPFTIDGPYSGSGTFTYTVARMVTEGALQTSALSDMMGGVAGLVAAGPIAGVALEMANTSGTGVAGGFSGGTIAPSGVSLLSFTGSTAQLNTAGAAAKVLTVSAAVGGRLLTHVIGAPAFVNAEFGAAFPTGLSSTLVIVKR